MGLIMKCGMTKKLGGHVGWIVACRVTWLVAAWCLSSAVLIVVVLVFRMLMKMIGAMS